MTTYTPPTIGAAAAFDGGVVEGGFDDLSTVLNGNFDQNNLPGTAVLPYEKFERGMVTETFVADSTGRGTAVFPVVVDIGTIDQWGPLTNQYDVDHTGIDFYLHSAAQCRFEGTVDLRQCKDHFNVSPLGGSQLLGYKFTLQLVVDGVVDSYLENAWQFPTTARGFLKYGFSLSTSDMQTLIIGKHRAHLRIFCEPQFPSAGAYLIAGNQLPALSQWLCPFRSLSVHAIYQ